MLLFLPWSITVVKLVDGWRHIKIIHPILFTSIVYARMQHCQLKGLASFSTTFKIFYCRENIEISPFYWKGNMDSIIERRLENDWPSGKWSDNNYFSHRQPSMSTLLSIY